MLRGNSRYCAQESVLEVLGHMGCKGLSPNRLMQAKHALCCTRILLSAALIVEHLHLFQSPIEFSCDEPCQVAKDNFALRENFNGTILK